MKINWKNILFNITLAANCLLCFLVFFDNRLVVPSWLQVAGRMHPLFLHFPIVLLVLSVCWILLIPKQQFVLSQDIGKWLLLFAACTSAITALMGLILSKEPGYDPESLQGHKLSGLAVSLIALLWYCFYDRIIKTKSLSLLTGALSVVALTLTGHLGAGITHGEGFLLAPLTPEKKQKKVLFEDAFVFNDMVKPILDGKCMGCHNNRKAKGDLIMETQELLLKGGKSGKLWDTSKATLGLLFERIHLPEEEEKHMPPAGKPQLTEQETAILYNWVKQGADFNIKVKNLEPADTLRLMAGRLFKSSGAEDDYDFAAASENMIEELNNNYRIVYPLAKGSPALAVDFFSARAYNADQLKDLLKIKTQIVSLNLDKMPVTDDQLQTIGELINLRTLNLSFTKITGSGLSHLGKLVHLKTLSLSGTAVKQESIAQLSSLKALHQLYAWNTGIHAEEVKQIEKNHDGLSVETGFRTDTVLLKLNPPILQNEEQIIDTPIALRLKHYVPGASIHYTLDGSEPDSIHAPVYNDHVRLDKQLVMKARAYKPGWLASDVVQNQFYHSAFKPDTIILLKPADSLYKGHGAITLYNLEKGDGNFRSGKWLGFRNNAAECLLVFSKPVNIQNITLSSMVNTYSAILPPAKVEIWGGNNSKNLRLLNSFKPVQPTKGTASLGPLECKFPAASVSFIKVVAVPVAEVPKQFSPKKQKGWFMVDEIFIN